MFFLLYENGKQISFLRLNPQYGFVGTSIIRTDSARNETERWPLYIRDRMIVPE